MSSCIATFLSCAARRNLPLLGAMLLGCVTTSAHAQTIPSTIDPGRVGQDIERSLQTQQPPAFSVPRIPGKAAALDMPPGADDVRLEIKQIVLVGHEKYSEDDLKPLYAELLGHEHALSAVYDAAERISQFYRDNGYLLSRAYVPEQEIHDGVVTIQIVEGKITGYEIRDAGKSESLIRAYVQKLMDSGPVHSRDLERYLMLMNDIPGVSVRSILVPSNDVPDGADIILSATKDTIQGYASADNFGNAYLGPGRFTLSAQTNGLVSSSDQTNFVFLTAPSNGELFYYNMGFHHHIGSQGTKAGFNMSYAKTDPSLPDQLGGLLEPNGEATTFTFDISHPFVRSRKMSIYGGFAFDLTKNKTDYAPGLSAIETQDDQRILRASTQITYIQDNGIYNGLNAVLSRGVDLFGASKAGDASLSRLHGDPTFTKLSFDASRIRHLTGPFTVLTGLTGQYSLDPLLSSEQFSLGGNEFGRGYDSSEITGDHGLGGKVELIYSREPENKILRRYQVYGFYDIGKVWSRDTLVGQDEHESIASVGIGTRLFFTRNLRGEAYIAQPLTQDVSSRGTRGDHPRIRFSLTAHF